MIRRILNIRTFDRLNKCAITEISVQLLAQ